MLPVAVGKLPLQSVYGYVHEPRIPQDAKLTGTHVDCDFTMSLSTGLPASVGRPQHRDRWCIILLEALHDSRIRQSTRLNWC